MPNAPYEPATAVIPLHNRADLLTRLLVTIHLQTVPFAEVIAVDNGSTDGAAELAEREGCRVIRMGSNTGFARAVNAGWKAARTPWVAILNSDVELSPVWLDRLLAAAGDASYVTGRILEKADTTRLDGTCDLVARSGCAWRAGHGAPDPGLTAACRIDIAPGTACLWRRDVLERLGGFEESFGSYLEDVDLGLRAIEHGHHGIYAPAATALHHGSATLGRWNANVVRLISRNQLRLVARHFDKALLRECLWPILIGQLLWGLVALRHGAGKAWLAGKLEGLRGFHAQGQPSAALRRFLDASERQIEAEAKDPYWNLYFRCAPRRRLGSAKEWRIDT